MREPAKERAMWARAHRTSLCATTLDLVPSLPRGLQEVGHRRAPQLGGGDRPVPDACLEEGGDDAAFITAVLSTIARARGMSNLARETGLTREDLYKALSPDGNPSRARS